jgi:hypothetical protein
MCVHTHTHIFTYTTSGYIYLRKVSIKFPNEIKAGINKRPKNDFLQKTDPEQSEVTRSSSSHKRPMSTAGKSTFSLAKPSGFP